MTLRILHNNQFLVMIWKGIYVFRYPFLFYPLVFMINVTIYILFR